MDGDYYKKRHLTNATTSTRHPVETKKVSNVGSFAMTLSAKSAFDLVVVSRLSAVPLQVQTFLVATQWQSVSERPHPGKAASGTTDLRGIRWPKYKETSSSSSQTQKHWIHYLSQPYSESSRTSVARNRSTSQKSHDPFVFSVQDDIPRR